MPADRVRILGRSASVLATAALVCLVAVNVGLPGAGEGDAALSALVLHYAFLPRLVVSLLAGAALGLSGVLFQQLLQNPLAAPDTLGVSAGAQLALTIGLLVLPGFHASHPDLLALAGALAAWALILGMAWPRWHEPVTLILVGFVVSFALGAIASLAMLLYQEYLTSLLLWGAGSLVQDDWDGARSLAWKFAACAVVVALLARPLLILGFGEASAASLGVSLRFVRPLLFAVAIFLSASVAAVVGIIGFIGLAAPHLARVFGAERLAERLIAAPVAGALLLALVDQGLQFLSEGFSGALPTGAVTALLGAPLLIVLLRRTPTVSLEGIPEPASAKDGRIAIPRGIFLAIGAACLVGLIAALLVGRGPEGFTLGMELGRGGLEWRLPRVLGAAAAGAALGISGCLVQRLFANPMASPEVLGIGGGVAVGLIVVLFALPGAGPGVQLAGAIAGALAVAVAVLGFGAHRGFTPERLLLVGIAVTALLNAVTLLFLAVGDPRVGQVLAWLGGSTYRTTMELALTVASLAVVALIIALPLGRWLDILPLGSEVARGLGVPLNAVRALVLVIAAASAGAAAVVIGPISFVGLLAPQMARFFGVRRALPQIAVAAAGGTAMVVWADWIGRIAFAPTELPAGILAVLLGTTLVAVPFLLRRSGRS